MQVIRKQHLHIRGWLLVNTTSATLASMLRMSGSMLCFMGALMWLNKLQMEILQNIRESLCSLSCFSIY